MKRTLFIAAATLLCACHAPRKLVTTVPHEDIPVVEPDLTVEQLRNTLQGTTYYTYRASRIGDQASAARSQFERVLIHEFTVERDGAVHLCVSSRVIEPTFLFVFTNGHLAKVVSPSFIGLRYSPDHILQADALSRDAFVDSIVSHVEANRRKSESLEPVPIPIFIPVGNGGQLRHAKRTAELEALYDPLLITLGGTGADVEDLFGPPLEVYTGGPDEVRVYGDVNEVSVRVAVTYVDDRVIAIHSHHLYDKAFRFHRNREPLLGPSSPPGQPASSS